MTQEVRRLLVLFALMLVALPVTPAIAAGPALGVYAEDSWDTDAGFDPLQRVIGLTVVRMPWTWREIEPRPGVYDWGRTDAVVGRAALERQDLLPFIVDAPAWASGVQPAKGDAWPPRDPAALAAFARAAVARYGPDGRFWRVAIGIPYRPIRTWQVWNEPNTPAFWPAGPDPAAYGALLRATGDAIHATDPGATVLAAGMPDSDIGTRLARYLRGLYASAAPGAFDALAVHAYAPDPASALGVVARARGVAAAAGQPDVPLWVTEFGYASAGEDSMVTTDEIGQARLVARTALALRRVAGPWNLRGLIAFRWRDAARPRHLRDMWPFHSGLLRRDGTPKPALGALGAALAIPLDMPGQAVDAHAGRLRLRLAVRSGRRSAARHGLRLRIRCSHRCTAGLVLVARVPRPGRGPLRHVVGRWTRHASDGRVRGARLRASRAQRTWLRARQHASLRLSATALTAAGAVATVERRVR